MKERKDSPGTEITDSPEDAVRDAFGEFALPERRQGMCLMAITSFVTLQLSCLVATGSGGNELQPTSNASVEARKVLNYLKRIYNHELVVSRDELPNWK
ncbi:MAG: hypothetical protein U9Q07_07285 [Planctomycetota bacterium]|nr:hypothetical protein [Planctomycetota bacterium]